MNIAALLILLKEWQTTSAKQQRMHDRKDSEQYRVLCWRSDRQLHRDNRDFRVKKTVNSTEFFAEGVTDNFIETIENLGSKREWTVQVICYRYTDDFSETTETSGSKRQWTVQSSLLKEWQTTLARQQRLQDQKDSEQYKILCWRSDRRLQRDNRECTTKKTVNSTEFFVEGVTDDFSETTETSGSKRRWTVQGY